MKKILSLVLVLAMTLCLFAGCGEQPTNPTTAAVTVEDAKTYLYAMYKEDDNTVARRDFKMVAAVMIDGVSFPIEWTTDSPDYVTIGAAQNNMVNIDIMEEPAEQVTFKLTGTMKDEAGNSASVTITRIIEAKKATGVEFVAAPVAGTAYKFALVQNGLGQTLYFTGAMDGYYLATSINPFEAVDVYVEDVDGGQRIFFTSAEGVKTYIDIVPRGADQPGKVNVILTEAPTCVYTWDADRKTFTTTVEENPWYLGTYGTYKTISASNTSYIENLEVIGDTQFPAGFCTVNIVASQVATPVAGTAYKFAMVQNGLGQTLYFTGSMDGYYLATSVNPADGVNVFVENVEGGARLYFMKGEVKTYIDVVPRGADQPGKVNVVLTEAPTCVYTWDADRKTFTTTVEENTWYLGTYGTYKTVSASNISYIEKLEVIGESQFPAGPYIVEGFMEMEPEFVEKHEHTPAAAVVENEKAATCTENGGSDSVVYCSECKEEISRTTTTVEATGHTEVVDEAVAATCTETGLTEGKHCSVCNEVLVAQEVVEAAGHTAGEAVTENVQGGGCGEAGSYESVVYCTVCEAEVSRETVEIPATGDHNYLTETARVESTCTVAGSVTMACSCGAEKTTELPVAEHPWDEGVMTTEPTCTELGVKVYTCTACGETKTDEAVPAKGHTAGEAVKENEVPATTTTEGSYESVVYCSVCNAEMSRETVATPVVEIPTNGVVAGVAYKISAYNANGTVWYSGTVGTASNGRYDITYNEEEAALVYVEEVEGGYLIYSTDGTTKTYIIMNDSTSGGALTTNVSEATVFVWNEVLNTLMAADPDNQRAFGCQNTSTYDNMSAYATSNSDGYNWGQFVPVG